jgi:hypothetical protein
LLALAIQASLSLLFLVLCGFNNNGSLPLLLCDGINVSGHLRGQITPSSAAVTVTATGAKKMALWLSLFLLALAIMTSLLSSLSS